jgi:hypothetical protein
VFVGVTDATTMKLVNEWRGSCCKGVMNSLATWSDQCLLAETVVTSEICHTVSTLLQEVLKGVADKGKWVEYLL